MSKNVLEARFKMPNKQYYKVRDKLTKTQILTIPNMLSFFRIALIPVIVWLYVFVQSAPWTILVFIISGVTDIVDGFIARRYNMTSDFGKMIDPVADKLTQATVLFCLLTDYIWIAIPLSVMAVKEIGSFIFRLVVFKKTEKVESASWHGKVNTVLLYATMMLHIIWGIWEPMPSVLSVICTAICTVMMIISCTLYTISGAKVLINEKKKNAIIADPEKTA